MDKVWMAGLHGLGNGGPTYDRSTEHLATGDKRRIDFSQVTEREIDKVRRGRDPIGVVRKPEKNGSFILRLSPTANEKVRDARLDSARSKT